MLTEIERGKLLDRTNETINHKANDFIVRKKLLQWITDIEDIQFILSNLPGRQSKKIVGEEEINALLVIIDEIMNINDLTFDFKVSIDLKNDKVNKV